MKYDQFRDNLVMAGQHFAAERSRFTQLVGPRCLRFGAKDLIPKVGADAKAGIGRFEVMLHVMALEKLHHRAFNRQVMGRVVDHVVSYIAQHRAGKGWRDQKGSPRMTASTTWNSA